MLFSVGSAALAVACSVVAEVVGAWLGSAMPVPSSEPESCFSSSGEWPSAGLAAGGDAGLTARGDTGLTGGGDDVNRDADALMALTGQAEQSRLLLHQNRSPPAGRTRRGHLRRVRQRA
jgi:hypothetical protein